MIAGLHNCYFMDIVEKNGQTRAQGIKIKKLIIVSETSTWSLPLFRKEVISLKFFINRLYHPFY